MPKDPIMLLSFVNMKLRDCDCSLEEFCKRECVDEAEVVDKLSSVGYSYDKEKNQFVWFFFLSSIYVNSNKKEMFVWDRNQ